MEFTRYYAGKPEDLDHCFIGDERVVLDINHAVERIRNSLHGSCQGTVDNRDGTRTETYKWSGREIKITEGSKLPRPLVTVTFPSGDNPEPAEAMLGLSYFSHN